MRVAFAFAVLAAFSSVPLAAAPLTLDRTTLDQLDHLRVGASIAIDHFPDATGVESTLHFERIDVYARGARLVAVDASGEHALPRSPRIELIGRDAAGVPRVSLGFDPGVEHVSGRGTAPSGAFIVTGERSAAGLTLRSVPAESSYPTGVVPRIVGGDDALPSGAPDASALEIALAGAQSPSGGLRTAVVAVDTDNEFMSERFANDTSAASAWIADLFATMNVMYERDLDVVLQQGTTMLRTTTDPYEANDFPADGTDLDEFGTYWQTHYASVQRSFAILLSGKATNGFSASGFGWIHAYCQTQSQGGSYSVNQVFTDPGVDVSFSALIVGHELGHNFGAYHTHCTNIANGAAPTGTNTIDQCYNGEASFGCYAGPTSCPSSGPGAPAGSLMSYCNLMGCGSTGQNVLQFHPTQIAVLNAYIAQNTPQCLAAGGGDLIFRNGFD